jgi:hypothetical protein
VVWSLATTGTLCCLAERDRRFRAQETVYDQDVSDANWSIRDMSQFIDVTASGTE